MVQLPTFRPMSVRLGWQDEGSTMVLVETKVNLVPAGSALTGTIDQSSFSSEEVLPESAWLGSGDFASVSPVRSREDVKIQGRVSRDCSSQISFARDPSFRDQPRKAD